MTAQPNSIHVICILWGDKYHASDVNRLHSMARRNTTKPIQFHLFSNEKLPDLDSRILRHPEPELTTEADHSKYNYRKEVGLCDDQLGGLTGQRVFFFDLDVLIIDDLDPLFQFPEDDQLYIINDWNTRGNHVGQASCYSFTVGALGYVKTHFEKNSSTVINKFGTASQEYLSEMILEKYKKLNFWPDHWFRSFRYHCLPWAFLRHFQVPKKPPTGVKALVFHGHPDIRDALEGRWSPPGIKKAARGWKRLYKACRPTTWIEDYWK